MNKKSIILDRLSNANASDLVNIYGTFDYARVFFTLFKNIPSTFSDYNKKDIDSFYEILNKYKDSVLFVTKDTTENSEGEKTLTKSLIALKEGILVIYNEQNKTLSYYFIADSLILKDLIENTKSIVDDTETINFILKGTGGYNLRSAKLPKRNINVEENYNDNLNTKKIVENLKKDHSGIYMFHGIPGTGKSNYIRFLKTQVKKDFIFVPIEIARCLDSPELFDLFLKNPDSILIIEDAEKLLITRENDNNSHLAGLLNLADGLIGQLLNIQVICTFNTSLENVDPALLRKGRLIESYKFTELTVDKTNNLLKKLGKQVTSDIPMALSDIFNYDEPESNLIKKKTRIGFTNN
jgi:hypothetical protein